MVNTNIQVWDKQGNTRLASTAINQIWINATQPGTGFDQCRNQNAGDPIVLYDQQVDRWMISQFTNPNSATGPGGTFPMCTAYSQTGDPTGNWFVYLGGEGGRATYHKQVSLGDKETYDYRVVSR